MGLGYLQVSCFLLGHGEPEHSPLCWPPNHTLMRPHIKGKTKGLRLETRLSGNSESRHQQWLHPQLKTTPDMNQLSAWSHLHFNIPKYFPTTP